MKKKVSIFISVIIVVLVIATASIYYFYPRKPFLRLNVSDVQQVTLQNDEGSQQVVLTNEEINKIVGFMQELESSQPGYVADYTASTIYFKFSCIDDSSLDFSICGTGKITLNGTNYRIKNDSAKELMSYAGELLKR